MNLRVHSGIAHSSLALNTFSILIRPSTGQTSQLWKAGFNCFLHRPYRLELRFQFPAWSSVG